MKSFLKFCPQSCNDSDAKAEPLRIPPTTFLSQFYATDTFHEPEPGQVPRQATEVSKCGELNFDCCELWMCLCLAALRTSMKATESLSLKLHTPVKCCRVSGVDNSPLGPSTSFLKLFR